MALDIRNDKVEPIKSVRFADTPDNDSLIATLVRVVYDEEDNPIIEITDDEGENCVTIDSVESAEYLMRALRYAIDNQWWDIDTEYYVEDDG